MKNYTKIIIIVVLTLVIFSVCDYITTYYHEETHRAIGDNFGCNDYNIEIRLFWGGSYRCYNYSERSEEEKLIEEKLHSLNEIVNYNIQSITSLILLLSLFVFVIVMVSKNE